MQRTTTLIGIVYLVVALAVAVGQYFTGALGAAPYSMPLAPAPDPVVITVWHSSEKQEWFQGAVQRFTATNPRIGRRPIQIRLRSIASGQQADEIAQPSAEDSPPSAVSPSSSLWLDRIRRQRAAAGQSGDLFAGGEMEPRSVALTPLIAVIWADRAAVLWPNHSTPDFWNDVHAAVAAPDWQAIAESHGFGSATPQYAAAERWGVAKFAHASPLTANSGLQALALMAYAHSNKTSGLTVADVQDPAFRTWLTEIEHNAARFPTSTSDFIDDLIRFGPGSVDIALMYENVALSRFDAARRIWGDVQIVYPPSNNVSDNPFAILDAPYTSLEQRQAAQIFRDFLLSHDEQYQAMVAYGFRPVDPTISVATPDPKSPFYKYQQFGVKDTIGQLAEEPSPDVYDALQELWQSQFSR